MGRPSLRAWRCVCGAAAALSMAEPRYGWALDPARDLSQYVEQSWGTTGTDGLPQNWVDAIAQTRDGYLWLGTQEGLARFDGARFVVFSSRTTPALRSNNVSALLVDSAGALWVGTYGGGLARYREGKWASWGQKEGLPNDFVVTLFEDRSGALWIGTRAGGVTRRRGDEMTTFSSKDGLPNDTVSAIAQDQDGSMWLGTDAGLSHLEHGRFTTLAEPAELRQPAVLALHVSPDGTLWIGTKGGGLWALRKGEVATARAGLAGKTVTAILSDGDGNEWIGTDREGIFRLEGDVVRGSTARAAGPEAPRYAVSALFEDRERNLWIGVDNLTIGQGQVGLLRLKDGKVSTFGAEEGLANDYVWATLEDEGGALWVGTSHGLSVARGDGAFRRVTPAGGEAIADAAVMTLAPARKGGLWIGTEGKGLGRLAGDRYEPIDVAGKLPNDTIRALYEDASGNLWIGTYGNGLTRLRVAEGAFSRFSPFPDVVVTSFAEGDDGALLVGTERGGIVTLRGETATVDPALAGDIVESLYDDGGDLWIGTYGGGLHLLRGGKLAHFTTREGLYDDVFYSIVDDGRGSLWTTSNRGVVRTSKRELLDVAAGIAGSRTVSPSAFGTHDGMKSSECNSGSPGGVRTRDGRLWFPTTKGLARIDPARLPRNMVVPPVLVEEAFVNREPVDLTRPRELPPESKDFSFVYTALSFATPERVRFKYRLEGFDRDWVDAGARRIAYYTNLAPGHYRFRVIAANDDGLWNEDGAEVSFELLPRFVQTTPFFLLVGAALILTGAGIIRLRVRQLRARAEELEQKVEERTAQLATTYQLLQEKDERLHEDLLRAREFQQRILPILPDDGTVRFGAVYKPADLVGGDLYDVCPLGPGRFRVLVADTTGHGVQASLRTMVLKTEYDRIKLGTENPRRALEELNRAITAAYPTLEMRCSGCCFDVELAEGGTLHVRYANAGHPPLLCVSRDAVSEVYAIGAFLGMLEEATFGEVELRMQKGELLVAYTDGLFEQEDRTGKPFGFDRLQDVLRRGPRHAGEAARGLDAALTAFAGTTEMDDDVLVLCVELVDASGGTAGSKGETG